MIVICTKCQAKFRVADEKIGPRGAKVRCSRCRTVFAVHPDLGTMPFAEDVAHGPGPSEARDVSAPAPPAPPGLLDDPFAAASAAGASAPPPPADDPFAVPAQEQVADARATLPVTDLSDLLGPPAAKATEQPPSRLPPPLPVFPQAPAAFDGGMHAGLDAAPRFDRPPPLAPSLPGLDLREKEGSPADDEGGLALEDRLTPPPTRVALASLGEPDGMADFELGGTVPAASPEPFADPFAAPAFDAASFDLGGDLPGGGPAPDADAEPAAPAPWPEPARRRGAPAPQPFAGPRAEAPVAPAPEARLPGRRGSPLRAVVVNGVSLLVVVAVAITFLVMWRTDRPLGASSLHPAALLDALRRDPATAPPFAAQEIRSGVYERARAAPLLFVRGKAVSRAPAAVRALRVEVEVVRASEVLARGEAIAGAVPTAEELYRAADAAALAKAARRAAEHAPREVKPGDALPFLVTIGDAPADLDGASLRVNVAAVRSVAR